MIFKNIKFWHFSPVLFTVFLLSFSASLVCIGHVYFHLLPIALFSRGLYTSVIFFLYPFFLLTFCNILFLLFLSDSKYFSFLSAYLHSLFLLFTFILWHYDVTYYFFQMPYNYSLFLLILSVSTFSKFHRDPFVSLFLLRFFLLSESFSYN